MLISFSGIDGCGKTTFASEVVQLLKTNGLKVNYIRVADKAISRRLGNLLKKVSYEKAKNAAYSSCIISSFFRKMLFVFDILLFWIIVLYTRLCKIHLICDRYFFDSIVHLNYLGISTNWFEKVLLTVMPEPDIIFWLVVPTEIAVMRDKEFPVDLYEKKHSLYQKLFEKTNAIRIENDDFNSTSTQIKKIVTDHFGERT